MSSSGPLISDVALQTIVAAGDESAAKLFVMSIKPADKMPVVGSLPEGEWGELSWLERLKLFDGKLMSTKDVLAQLDGQGGEVVDVEEDVVSELASNVQLSRAASQAAGDGVASGRLSELGLGAEVQLYATQRRDSRSLATRVMAKRRSCGCDVDQPTPSNSKNLYKCVTAPFRRKSLSESASMAVGGAEIRELLEATKAMRKELTAVRSIVDKEIPRLNSAVSSMSSQVSTRARVRETRRAPRVWFECAQLSLRWREGGACPLCSVAEGGPSPNAGSSRGATAPGPLCPR